MPCFRRSTCMARMTRAQYTGSSVALGRCLLRLLPEDHFDQQPLSAAGVTALVADIRLDNREELGAELGLSSQQTAVMADSAMLLAAWQRWREQCVEHLSGAFSFAVWNQQEQHLFLARDHTGERPLFYASTANCFAFASMPKGLHPLSFVGSGGGRRLRRALSHASQHPDRTHHLSQYATPAARLRAQRPPRKEKSSGVIGKPTICRICVSVRRKSTSIASEKGLITQSACACALVAASAHN